MDVTVTLNQRLLGQVVNNVLVFANLSPDPIVLQSFADSMRASLASGIVASMTNQWSIDNITYTFNESLPIYSLTYDFTLGLLTGGSSTDPLPTTVAMLVSTSFAGPPPNRGRVYLAGFTEGAVTGGIFTVAAYGTAEALVADWADGLAYTGGTAFLRIARRNNDGTIAISSPVTSVIGRQIPATQRRRRIGVGS